MFVENDSNLDFSFFSKVAVALRKRVRSIFSGPHSKMLCRVDVKVGGKSFLHT